MWRYESNMKNKLKEIRELKRMTQIELSEITKIPVNRISYYENNHGLPSIKVLLSCQRYFVKNRT